jgi:uncharacterized phage protein gp47/JayE
VATFQLKSWVSIVASMINRMKATQTAVTDYNVGAVARTMLEAPAIEIEQLYQQAFNMVTAAIPVSVYTSFSFAALAANAATGSVPVTIASQATDTLISAGTTFTPTGSSNTYQSTADATVPAGSTSVAVPVAATTTGSASNLAANTSFTLTPSPSGFVSAVNLSAFVNGRDTETDDERLLRFQSYISTLSGATVSAIEYGLSTVSLTDSSGNITEQVKLYQVVEPYVTDASKPIADVVAYIHNGVGSTSGDLVAQAQLVINGYTDSSGTKVPGYKAAGIPCTVSAATEVPTAVTGVITLVDDTYDFDTVMASAVTAVNTYLLGLTISDSATVSSASAILSEISALVKAIDGVFDVTFTTPAANVTVPVGSKIMPGTITFTQGTTP